MIESWQKIMLGHFWDVSRVLEAVLGLLPLPRVSTAARTRKNIRRVVIGSLICPDVAGNGCACPDWFCRQTDGRSSDILQMMAVERPRVTAQPSLN